MILVRRVVTSEKEWVVEKGEEKESGGSQEGESKLETAIGDDKLYKVYIIWPSCK